MAQRKQQKADREAEERRKMAAENLSERRKRTDEQKKKKQVTALETETGLTAANATLSTLYIIILQFMQCFNPVHTSYTLE